MVQLKFERKSSTIQVSKLR